MTYSLIKCRPNESKELPQQDAVSWFISTVLDGQRLQQSKGDAAVTCRMVSPPRPVLKERVGIKSKLLMYF